jgi:type IV pilus assembly protein PilM
MPSTNMCWGIEIGASAIKALKLEADGEGGVRVLEQVVIDHPKPLSTPDVNVNDVLRVSLGTLVSQHDFGKVPIAVSVPGHSAFARFAKLPPVEPKKVPDIVKFEAMQQIPFPLDQVEWDFQTFVTPDSPDVEVGIFAITRERVNEHLQRLADVGITPTYVVLSPIAVYNALAYDLDFGAKTPGTIIVDVGTTSTDLVIATPGRMWVRTFPLGGHQFTDALVQQFQASYSKAEKLKREAEDSKYARQVFQAMRPIFTDLAQDIQRSIGYYQSLNRDADLTRLIGIGSTFRLPGLRKYLKQQLSMDVYRIEEFKKLKVTGDQSPRFNDNSLNFCTAYGLALQGLGLNAVGGNLMPTSVLRKSMWREKVPMFAAAAGVALAASGAMFLFPLRDSMGVSANQPGAIIRQALARQADLKREATEAGVLDAGDPDMRVANILTLLDRRGIFQYVVNDVGVMLSAADTLVPEWQRRFAEGRTPFAGQAFTLNRFDTQYLPPSAPADDTGFGFDPSGGQPSADPLNIAQYPRLECTLILNTRQPEPRRFAEETIDRWLRANGVRADVPYEIVTDARPSSVSEPGREGTDMLAGAGAPRFPGGPGGPGGRGFVMSGGDVLEQDAQGGVGLRARVQAGAVVIGGGGSPPPSAAEQSADVARAAAQNDLDRTVPLLPPVDGSLPPETGVVRVTWYVVFKPAVAADGDATNPGGPQ